MRAEMHPTNPGRSRNRSPRPATTQSRVQPTTKTTAQEWTEPQLQEPVASFEEHGGGPFGVLEDMQPLGTRPSAKVRARVKAEAPRKNNLHRTQAQPSHAASGAEPQDTPETTPSLDVSDTIPLDPLPGQPLPVVDDERDQDYTPRPSKKAPKTRLSRSAAKRAASPAQPAVASTPTPSSVSVSTPAASNTPAPPPASSTKRSSRSMKLEDPAPPPEAASSPPAPAAHRNIGAIVDAAVKKSQQAGKGELGAAIQDIYRQSQSDGHLSSLLLGILDQTATPKQVAEFRDHVQRARKKLKGKDANSSKKHKRAKKSSSSPPPEMVPRQSIESPSVPRKPRISLKINRSKPAAEKPSPATVKPRTSSMSSSSSLSSLTSMEEDGIAVAPAVSYPVPDGAANGDSLAAVPGIDGPPKRSSAEAGNSDSERVFLAKKQKLDETVNRDAPTEESHIRPDLTAVQQKPKNPIIPPVKLTANGPSTVNARSREVSMGSPLTDISSPSSSHNTTPKAAAMPAKVFKKKAKTKQSPVKKVPNYEGDQNGTSRIESPAVGYDVNEESDNHDFCSACGGSGFLLCCDGCDRSFHFSCCDPPLTQDASELDEPWYCFGCIAKRAQPQRNSRGLFSSLLTNLDKRNPTVFLLPQEIREYFVGVNTTKDGRFVEQLATKTRRGAGYDELPDNFKTKDAKGHVILCHQCGLSSLGRREIIACDQCSAHWHLDCLDPPLANAPYRDHTGRKIRDWVCPLHVDHILREMEVPRLADRQLQRERRIHMRRPRGAKILDTSLNRGFINNGVIEIAPDSSDDESEFYDEEVAGVVYRLPEKGIKLDFIDKVKRDRAAKEDGFDDGDDDARPVKKVCVARQSNNDFFRRSFLDQRTALDLVGFANQQTDLDFNGDQVSTLLGTLIAEAPQEIVKQMVEKERELRMSPPAPDQSEQDYAQQRKALELLQGLITKKLAALAEK